MDALVIRKVVEDPVVVKRFDVVALVRLALVEKRFVAVRTDDEAKVVDALVAVKFVEVAEVATSAEIVVVARVEVPVTPNVPATPSVYAEVVAPTPTFPLERILNIDTPVDDATLNGLSDGEPCTLNE